ncbi:hypothetical protein [Flavobacterium sp. NKUCC04_CG]|uniref:hypothetical protein n=1 Tax=Flavobacterium sp. NKUCC04_CG TaxID=2842121 RepID=UPI001C5B30BF|nr:hypothetical protein [Flavobacterium sp. NKUCC04_CG]MBW3518502.1 hypothetical protein [Flavobacterium sp. NKUCC04_CG]
MKNSLENTQKKIMHLMVSIAQKDQGNAERQIEEIKEMILEGLDYTADDEELVKWSKYFKIVEELESKLGV